MRVRRDRPRHRQHLTTLHSPHAWCRAAAQPTFSPSTTFVQAAYGTSPHPCTSSCSTYRLIPDDLDLVAHLHNASCSTRPVDHRARARRSRTRPRSGIKNGSDPPDAQAPECNESKRLRPASMYRRLAPMSLVVAFQRLQRRTADDDRRVVARELVLVQTARALPSPPAPEAPRRPPCPHLFMNTTIFGTPTCRDSRYVLPSLRHGAVRRRSPPDMAPSI